MNKIIPKIEELITAKTGIKTTYIKHRSVSGGCINEGFEFITNNSNFFVKTNSASKYPKMFETEYLGLNLLSETKAIRTPEIIGVGENGSISFLVLEFINASNKKSNYWSDFGTKLAKIHKNTSSYFGLEHNNYIGSLPQSNDKHENWTDFFANQRLQPLVKQSYNLKLTDKSFTNSFENIFIKLETIIPREEPSLLHGDLWGGNVITDEKGEVCIIDPAVYYGHREVDIAFSTMFGAFPDDFYNSYNETLPLQHGWKERIDIFNLYPLLVHLLLFGSSYYPQIKSILKKYQ